MQLHALACLLVVVARAGPAGEQCRPLCGIFVASFFVLIPMYLISFSFLGFEMASPKETVLLHKFSHADSDVENMGLI